MIRFEEIPMAYSVFATAVAHVLKQYPIDRVEFIDAVRQQVSQSYGEDKPSTQSHKTAKDFVESLDILLQK